MAKTPPTEFRNLERGLWSHVDFLDSHPVQPHYNTTEVWVCYTCKQKIKLDVAFQHRNKPLILDR